MPKKPDHTKSLGFSRRSFTKFTPGTGWQDIDTSSEPYAISYIANTRMHLTREQVAALLPMLRRFVRTGELDKTRFVWNWTCGVWRSLKNLLGIEPR